MFIISIIQKIAIANSFASSTIHIEENAQQFPIIILITMKIFFVNNQTSDKFSLQFELLPVMNIIDMRYSFRKF